MFIKILKWTGFFIAAVIVMASGFYLKVYFSTESRLNKKYAFELPAFTLRPDSAMLAEGQRLVTTKGCNDCHGKDLGGRVFIDDPALGRVTAPNLTKGLGGLPQDYSANDWLRSLKHGLNRDSTTLRIMPSYEYTHLTEKDMKAIISYGLSLAPIDRVLPTTEIKPVGRILLDLDKLPGFTAEKINHTAPLVEDIKPEVSIEFGKYLAVSCTGCHKENLKGGEPVLPGSPLVADITSGGHVGRWSEDQFLRTLRTGTTPEGKKLPAEFMPWPMTKSYSDVELKALYSYLRSI